MELKNKIARAPKLSRVQRVCKKFREAPEFEELCRKGCGRDSLLVYLCGVADLIEITPNWDEAFN